MATASELNRLSILVFEAGRDDTEHGCTAQCLEHDVVSQGTDIKDAVYETLRAVVTARFLANRGDVRMPGHAPTEMWTRFRLGKTVEISLEDFAGADVRLDQEEVWSLDVRVAA